MIPLAILSRVPWGLVIAGTSFALITGVAWHRGNRVETLELELAVARSDAKASSDSIARMATEGARKAKERGDALKARKWRDDDLNAIAARLRGAVPVSGPCVPDADSRDAWGKL